MAVKMDADESKSANDKTNEPFPSIGDTVDGYTMEKMMASGPYGRVYRVVDAQGEPYAMKMEKDAKGTPRTLCLDVFVGRLLKGTVGFPSILAVGRASTPAGNAKYVVMQMLGPDLNRLRRSVSTKHFSKQTAIKIALATLERLRALHDVGWISRDIKAPNFTIGRKDNSTIYMLDFGLAERINRTDPRQEAMEEHFVGTFQYASLAAHGRFRQGPKDDCESWFYMCLECHLGTLPWHDTTDEDEQYKRKLRLRLHGSDEQTAVFEKCPHQFRTLLAVIDDVHPAEMPPYNRLRDLLIEAANEDEDVDLEGRFDWQQNYADWLIRAREVGHVGESVGVTDRVRLADPPSNPATLHSSSTSDSNIW